MPAPEPVILAHQFEEVAQQREADLLGMWVFLATEVLFFGGLFLGYTVYRLHYPEAFHHASRATVLAIGATNTALLLGSSLLVALAVHASALGERRTASRLLWLTAGAGLLFLGLKGVEYHHEIGEGLLPGAHFHLAGAEPAARIFFSFYFVMTGLHAVHVLVGIVALAVFAWRLPRSERVAPVSVELLGLYWHFVDLVWVFLFPLIYLIGRAR